jgi:hypothetical protein
MSAAVYQAIPPDAVTVVVSVLLVISVIVLMGFILYDAQKGVQ